jgi:hypothetical protein
MFSGCGGRELVGGKRLCYQSVTAKNGRLGCDAVCLTLSVSSWDALTVSCINILTPPKPNIAIRNIYRLYLQIIRATAHLLIPPA